MGGCHGCRLWYFFDEEQDMGFRSLIAMKECGEMSMGLQD